MTSIVNMDQIVVRDEGLFACALQALAQRNFSKAEAEFTALLMRAALSDSDRAFALNKRGVSRIGLDRRDLARSDFELALEANPSFAPALTNLGNLLLEDGEPRAAIANYERAIAIDPEFAIAYFHLGVAYKRTGRIAEGVRALRQAQRLEARASASGSWRRVRRP